MNLLKLNYFGIKPLTDMTIVNLKRIGLKLLLHIIQLKLWFNLICYMFNFNRSKFNLICERFNLNCYIFYLNNKRFNLDWQSIKKILQTINNKSQSNRKYLSFTYIILCMKYVKSQIDVNANQYRFFPLQNFIPYTKFKPGYKTMKNAHDDHLIVSKKVIKID